MKRWLVWRYELDASKPRWAKRLIAPRTGKPADVTNPRACVKFDDARKAYAVGGYDGIGFVLVDGDGIIGIDLDHCVDKATGELEPWAQQLIEQLGTYVEWSPSGEGVHLFLADQLPQLGWNRKGRVEVYVNRRYLTCTGHRLPDVPEDLADAATLGESLVGTLTRAAQASRGAQPASDSVDELRRKMFASKHGRDIKRLFDGDKSAYGGDWSAADFALCAHLNYWAHGDVALMDATFRRSKLMRDKWNQRHTAVGETYGRTISDGSSS